MCLTKMNKMAIGVKRKKMRMDGRKFKDIGIRGIKGIESRVTN